MGKIDNLADDSQETRRLWAAIRKLQTATPLASASVERGRLRFYAGSQLLIEDGNFTVSGTAEITGTLDGSGTFSWTGPVTFTGATHLQGNTDITGTLAVSGATTLSNNLTVGSGGKITVSGGTPVTLGITSAGQPGLDWGGAWLASTGSGVALAAGNASLGAVGGAFLRYGSNDVIVSSTGTAVDGNFTVSGAKSFRIPHPSKDGYWLQHGSTESPVSGIEYAGTVSIGPSGTRQVTLPEYFEALAKPAGRTVFVSGNGFAAGWSEIVDGKFKVTGEPGGSASWLVKAERIGADFEAESKIRVEADA